MGDRTAACACGQLQVRCAGEPVRISICHCLDCQKRTGSIFGMQARYPHEAVSVAAGTSKAFTRKADSGNTVTFHFCPNCGSTVYWELSGFPDVVAVAVGAFADSNFPSPRVSVFERSRHDWLAGLDAPGMEHLS
ncbi:MAG: GFA family protein [Hyphomicrobiaceae bacterium]